MKRTRWYKDAFIYQIYPRSFCDSNGDGIGDLRGIISKLDYLKELGVTAVWLSPCYKSPNDDNGYDISDYRDIMDEFGTLEDWEEMVEGMHKRGIKLIMDLVVNHTSDEHYWFQEARKSKDNPYRDYYIWRKGKGKNGKKPPNNWTSRFGGSAWEYCEETDEYYLHLFTKKQPDLNWKNPKVRQEVHDIVKYWLDKGCDGFRCDVITYIAKEDGLPDGRWNIALRGDEHFNNHPTIHSYLHALNKEVLSNYDCMTVGEGPGMNVENAIKYTSEENEELDTVFTFEHMNTDTYFQLIPRKFKLSRLKKVFAKYQHGLRNKGWNSLYFENHDQPRCLPRFVGDYGPYRKQAAKMLAVALYMQQGTPYIYQGQEIGMTNYPWKSLDEFQDVMVKYVMGVI
ncbi:MAG: alpha-glucosidase, partial [Christensenellales bacterium]